MMLNSKEARQVYVAHFTQMIYKVLCYKEKEKQRQKNIKGFKKSKKKKKKRRI